MENEKRITEADADWRPNRNRGVQSRHKSSSSGTLPDFYGKHQIVKRVQLGLWKGHLLLLFLLLLVLLVLLGGCCCCCCCCWRCCEYLRDVSNGRVCGQGIKGELYPDDDQNVASSHAFTAVPTVYNTFSSWLFFLHFYNSFGFDWACFYWLHVNWASTNPESIIN